MPTDGKDRWFPFDVIFHCGTRGGYALLRCASLHVFGILSWTPHGFHAYWYEVLVHTTYTRLMGVSQCALVCALSWSILWYLKDKILTTPKNTAHP